MAIGHGLRFCETPPYPSVLLLFPLFKATWVWVENRYPKWNPGRWKHGLKPAVVWWFHFDPYPDEKRGGYQLQLTRHIHRGPLLEGCRQILAHLRARRGAAARRRLREARVAWQLGGRGGGGVVFPRGIQRKPSSGCASKRLNSWGLHKVLAFSHLTWDPEEKASWSPKF